MWLITNIIFILLFYFNLIEVRNTGKQFNVATSLLLRSPIDMWHKLSRGDSLTVLNDVCIRILSLTLILFLFNRTSTRRSTRKTLRPPAFGTSTAWSTTWSLKPSNRPENLSGLARTTTVMSSLILLLRVTDHSVSWPPFWWEILQWGLDYQLWEILQWGLDYQLWEILQ